MGGCEVPSLCIAVTPLVLLLLRPAIVDIRILATYTSVTRV